VTGSTNNPATEGVIRLAAAMDRMLQFEMVTERTMRSLTVNDSAIRLAIRTAIRFESSMESIAI
jgi:hypothetical protein